MSVGFYFSLRGIEEQWSEEWYIKQFFVISYFSIICHFAVFLEIKQLFPSFHDEAIGFTSDDLSHHLIYEENLSLLYMLWSVLLSPVTTLRVHVVLNCGVTLCLVLVKQNKVRKWISVLTQQRRNQGKYSTAPEPSIIPSHTHKHTHTNTHTHTHTHKHRTHTNTHNQSSVSEPPSHSMRVGD